MLIDSKRLIRSLFVVVLFIGATLLSYYQFFSPQTTYIAGSAVQDSELGWKFPQQFRSAGQVTVSDAYSELRKQGLAGGLPVRLQIPSINVDAAIEDAFITPDGKMDIPAGCNGCLAGLVGITAPAAFVAPWAAVVIGAMLISPLMGPILGTTKVFYNLNKLKIGDHVQVVDDFNKTLSFVVRTVKIYDRNADATEVFLSKDNKAHLNLIACDGVWNKQNDTYPDRRVVFTDAIDTATLQTDTISPPAIEIKARLPETANNPFINSTLSFSDLYANPVSGSITSLIILTVVIILAKIILRK